MADSRQKRYGVAYNVMLDPTHRAMLEQIAEAEGVKGSNLIRRWVSQAFRMKFEGEPRCITGQNCLCPRVHEVPRQASVSDQELLQRHQGQNGPAAQ